MLDQDFILLVFNCNKYRYKAIQQKQTWLLDIPSNLIYFHVIGDPLLDKDYLFDFLENILYVKTDDDYISLPKKVIKAYNTIQETFFFKYIFKTDDDQHVEQTQFFQTLMNVLIKIQPKIHYGGKIVDVKIPYISEYYKLHPELPKDLKILPTQYCNGRFYFLSSEAILSLTNVKNKTLIEKEYLEDYAIGFHLASFLKDNIMNLTTDKFFVDNLFEI